MNVRYVVSAALGLALLVGCSGTDRPELVPVQGTVTLNGEPLAGATVIFDLIDKPEGFQRPSSGRTDEQGHFQVGTYGSADGLPEGKYRVAITKKEMVGEPPEGFNPEDSSASLRPVKYEWVVPRTYVDPDDSGLTAEVTAAGLQPDTFALEREGPPEIEIVGAGTGP